MLILDPRKILSDLKGHLSDQAARNIVVVGSLAAAYDYWPRLKKRGLATKDADFLIHPAGDIAHAAMLMKELLGKGWKRSSIPRKECFPESITTPPELCRAIRLILPASADFFVELLGVPDLDQAADKVWKAVDMDDGRYGLPCFRFTGLIVEGAVLTPEGLRCALPSMMTLANLLSHPALGTQRVNDQTGGPGGLRSEKDLGRALALWFLEGDAGRRTWHEVWLGALMMRFPETWKHLAARIGAGLEALVADRAALREAHGMNLRGLLAGFDLEVENTKALAEELLDGPVRRIMTRV
jgi:hypothetical protein